VAGRKVAFGVKGMTQDAPPRWLESVLLRCLRERDRETIAGDLLEEYREEKLPHLGHLRADIWYMRQVISFLFDRSFGGSTMRASLTWMSMFTALAGVWLVVMENVLKHPGYSERTAIAALIVFQALATVFFLMGLGRAILRITVQLGAVGVVLVGASALIRTLDAPHFEGFVGLIGSALIVQGATAIVVLGGAAPPKDGLAR
jgi:hypothetical protein